MAEIADVLEYYSRCNKGINTGMIKIIKENDIFNKTFPGYYKTINEILFHILAVDLSWTSDLRQIIVSDVFENELYKNFDDHNNISPYKSIIEFERDRTTLDDLLIKFIKEIDQKDLEKELPYKNKKNKTSWEILIHMFNHQTHHRGQISQILDENNISNDFSNMIRYDRKF